MKYGKSEYPIIVVDQKEVYMKLSSKWTEHSPDFLKQIVVEECSNCECMIAERHVHCSCCGRLLARGSGEVVASYRLNLGKRTIRRVGA
jgi:hypothetical protein